MYGRGTPPQFSVTVGEDGGDCQTAPAAVKEDAYKYLHPNFIIMSYSN